MKLTNFSSPFVSPSKHEVTLHHFDFSNCIIIRHINSHRLIISAFFSLIILFFFNITPIKADNLNSNSFTIKMSTINMTGGEKTSPSFTLNDTVGQTFQGAFDSNGFKVRAGFQYVRPNIPFRFTISNLDINFGTIVAGIGSTASNTLTISNGSSGYTVKALEDHPLRLIGLSNTIPNTTCDLGTTCTTTSANIWASDSYFGFGYNMSGTDVNTSDFINSAYFKPFPADSASESPVTVMSRTGITTNSVSTVTYKVNVSGSQAAGKYQNSIQFIATPSY